MCGIVGYIGNRDAQPVLFQCLNKLEYRGYDSCGIAVQGDHIRGNKAAGRVSELSQNTATLLGNQGMGHTRWATHGLPTEINAHPHYDCTRKIAVVHNGIVRNYLTLKHQLEQEGHCFISETDTEVIPHLIEKHFKGNLFQAVEATLSEIEGSYALVVMMEGQHELIVSRKESPLIIGIGKDEKFVASDAPAILEYTNRVIYMEDEDIAVISENSIKIVNNHEIVQREIHQLLWDKKENSKGEHDHFMIKEIYEQPRVIRDSLNALLQTNSGESCFSYGDNIHDLLLLACGTSYHAGLIGKYIIEELLGIPTRIEIGSEFNHRNRLIIPSVTIAITQSGETADVLMPLKKLRQAHSKTFVITNVLGSSASRIADSVIYTHAGPEVGVASTKTFIAQLIEMYKLVLSSDMIDPLLAKTMWNELKKLPEKAQTVIDQAKQIEECAIYLTNYKAIFYVGRGINYPVALEGALKMKEVSYIHAEGYAAGELKHGPFALLDKNTPVIAILSQDGVYDSMVNNIKEIKARQSPLIALVDNDEDVSGILPEKMIKVPRVHPLLSPVINVIALQLMAYYAAKYKGCPVDFPRNLAKSVTVE
jgi:glucosamine--fructose-6-phosphate aminotransferase (isomerizing)